MGKLYQGKGKLYDSDDTNFISDTRYQITVESTSDGRQKSSGTLFEIEYDLLVVIQGKECVLHLKDGAPVKIQMLGLQYPPSPYQLNFLVQSEIG